MCGICGMVVRAGGVASPETTVRRMLGLLRHRGPDSEGIHSRPGVTLGVRRLAVIDITGGHQPLYNEDRTIALVANGMIYNYRELTAELETAGHRFRTRSDCEVILHLYEEHGLEFVQRLRGMFAFALWDERRGRMLLGRDPMGQKPLYFAVDERRIVFASEIHALMGSGVVARELDAAAINQYFHYQFVPEPRTPIAGVRKVPAATLLDIDVERWSVRGWTYWRMLDAQPVEGDPVSHISEAIDGVGKLVLRSDVPVGVALSAGLDSSVVAAMAARTGTPVTCFSVGYPGRPAYDERARARRLADQLRLEFFDIEMDEADAVEDFPSIVASADDPIADIAAFGYAAVSRSAQQHGIRVLLQGQGGDELFWYADMRDAAHQSARKAGADAPSRLLQYLRPLSPRAIGMRRWLKDMAGVRSGLREYRRDRHAPADQLVFYDLVPDFLDAQYHASEFYGHSMTATLQSRAAWEPFTVPRPWLRPDLLITERICATYLTANGIALGDRLSMAHSVEQRLPLVDDRFVDLVIGLRKVSTDVHLPPKTWLRQAAAEMLPAWVMGHAKQGFQPPVREWHRAIFARHGADLDEGLLASIGVIAPEAARRLADGVFPRHVITPISYKALVLEHWLRSFGSGDWRISNDSVGPHSGAEVVSL